MGEKTCARLLRLLVRAGGRCRREGREVGALDQGMRSEAAPQAGEGGSTFPRLGDRSGKGHAPRLISS